MKQKFSRIFDATKTHSLNLGRFVFIYKSLMAAQKYIHQKEQSHHAFVAGLIGGYFVFGEYSNINYQVSGRIPFWGGERRISQDHPSTLSLSLSLSLSTPPSTDGHSTRLCCTCSQEFSSGWPR